MASMMDAALAYASAGIRIFPVFWPVFRSGYSACACHLGGKCRDIGKHPLIHQWQNRASCDPLFIKEVWSKWPSANIGAPTGTINGFDVLDVDHHHGANLDGLEIPPTRRAVTGNGGEHILFAHVAGMRNRAGKPRVGLDIRGDGGFIVVPPSMHVSGNRYSWGNKLTIATAPGWFSLLGEGETAAKRDASEWADHWIAGAAEGDRNTSIARMTGYLLKRNLDPIMVLEIVCGWNIKRFKPPLLDSEVHRIVDSICAKARRQQ